MAGTRTNMHMNMNFKSSQGRTDAAHSSTKTMASSPPPLQSNLSYCNLKDAESDSSNPEAVKYQQEILSHNALDAVFESPPKVRPALPTALKEFLVSVQSWSDAKGHTEYTITTSMSGSAAAWVTTSRRFSDFILLHSRICTPLGLRREFPVPKTPFVTDGVKRFRLRALQGYLRHACAAAVARAGPSTSDGTLGSELPMALSEFLGLEVPSLGSELDPPSAHGMQLAPPNPSRPPAGAHEDDRRSCRGCRHCRRG